MKQIYHPYTEWEDYKAGMWRDLSNEEKEVYLQKAIVFTGDCELYGSWMLKVIDSWPITCEHNLTNLSQNRRAWIGHAACQLAIGCPEYITRQAWGYLTDKQRAEANAKADYAIFVWEERAKGKDGDALLMF